MKETKIAADARQVIDEVFDKAILSGAVKPPFLFKLKLELVTKLGLKK